MARGKVKWFNDQKGYGFITPEGGNKKDIFVHYSNVDGDGIKEGDSVNFDMVEGPKGLSATNVTVL